MKDHQREDRAQVRLDVLVLEEEATGVFVAQCLQHDIVVQATNERQLRERFVRAVQMHLAEDDAKGRAPLSTVPQAPRRFWDIYTSGELSIDSRDLPIFVPSERATPMLDVRARFAQASQVEAHAS